MTQRLTLDLARCIAEAAIAGPRTAPERRIAIAVCDAGGHLLTLLREEDAPPLLAHIATQKAFTCVAYGKPTRTLSGMAEEFGVWFDGISRVAASRMGGPLIATKGGVLVRGSEGRLLGAAGVAGEAGDQDEALAVLGIAAAGLHADAG